VSGDHARMSYADAAWLHMDRPTNLLVINSVLLFDERLELARLKDVWQRRLVERYPRFRQRVVESRVPMRGPSFEDDPRFDIDRHLHHIGLPHPGDRAALQELVGDLMATPLDREKPLWDMYLLDGFGSGCAVMVRMHHCLADGIALARVMLSLTDTGAAEPAADPAAEPGFRDVEEHHVRLAGITQPATSVLSAARTVAGALTHQGMETLVHPQHLVELSATVGRDAQTLAKLLFSPPDASTSLRGELGGRRRVAWSSPLDLAQVKDVAHAQRATVNDILLAAVSGALHSYLLRRDGEAVELHAIVPFNLRPLDEPIPRDLGNRFGLVFLPLPVDVSGPKARLREVMRRMAEIKDSIEGPLSYAILSAIGMTPPAVESLAIDMFSAKGTAVMTNVPGPPEPVYLAGVPLRAVLVWAPTSGSVGMSVSIFSYRGEVTIGLMVDAALVPDPQLIVDRLQPELAALRRLRPAPAPAARRARSSPAPSRAAQAAAEPAPARTEPAAALHLPPAN
jgi:diacylglycerol O-acyltransferase / wax synthase